MPEINLPQAEADALLAMEKHRIDDNRWNFPDPGESIHIPLISASGRENFHLDISRGKIDLSKGTYQNRSRQIVILARLDFGGQPHRNPDNVEIPCPHIHVYKEGFGDKWAIPLPYDIIINIDDRWQLLKDFMQFCNIVKPPKIERGLFS
jgi:hypothetical protein